MGGRREGEWLDLVADLLSAPPVIWPDEQVLRLLVESFDAVGGCFYARAGSAPPVMREWPAGLATRHVELAELARDESRNPHPVLRYFVATGRRHVGQIADFENWFVDRKERDHWFGLHRSLSGTPHQIALPLRLDPLASRAFLVGRDELYTAAEMALAHRLLRLLTALDRHLTAVAGWSLRAGPRAAEVAADLRMTPRELAVLDLLGRGLTAAAIARRLQIAERTVQKHLQRCYAKLGTPERLAAVLRAQELGLLGPTPVPQPGDR